MRLRAMCIASLTAAVCAASAGGALASGGPGGLPGGGGGGGVAGGGGGGGGGTPVPVVNPSPCARAVSTSGGKGIFATGTQVRASFNITNCSTAGDETVNTSFTEFGKGFSSTGQGEGACTPATVSWSGGSFTVKTGSTQGISTTAPSMTCPFDSQQDQVQIMVRDPSTGTVLATAVYSYQILPI